MIESYFNIYDKTILPTKYSIPLINSNKERTSLSPLDILPSTTQSTLSNKTSHTLKTLPISPIQKNKPFQYTLDTMSPTNYTQGSTANYNVGFSNERKKNLEYTHEVASLQSKVLQLEKELRQKDSEIRKMKLEAEKDGNYLIQLEKMLMYLKQEKENKIKQSIKTIPSLSTIDNKRLNNTTITNKKGCMQSSNNNNNNKSGNSQTTSPIPNSFDDRSICSNKIDNIIKANEECELEIQALQSKFSTLNQFKTNVYELSKEEHADQFNTSILKPLHLIDDMLYKLMSSPHIDKTLPEYSFDFITNNKSNLNILPSHNYESITSINDFHAKLSKAIIDNVNKQYEEYVYNLDIKEEEIELMLKEIENIQREIKEISLQNEEKKKIINTLKVENEFIKMRDQLKQEEMKREKERELSLNNKLNNQNNKSTQMKVYPMKRSVNYSVGKIKRNFDMNDPNNNAFVHNIKTKIQ